MSAMAENEAGQISHLRLIRQHGGPKTEANRGASVGAQRQRPPLLVGGEGAAAAHAARRLHRSRGRGRPSGKLVQPAPSAGAFGGGLLCDALWVELHHGGAVLGGAHGGDATVGRPDMQLEDGGGDMGGWVEGVGGGGGGCGEGGGGEVCEGGDGWGEVGGVEEKRRELEEAGHGSCG